MITKAIIKSYEAGTHTVAVQPVGSLGTYWKDIPVAVTITGNDCAAGNYCAVASFNDSHPTDAVVIATWAYPPTATSHLLLPWGQSPLPPERGGPVCV